MAKQTALVFNYQCSLLEKHEWNSDDIGYEPDSSQLEEIPSDVV